MAEDPHNSIWLRDPEARDLAFLRELRQDLKLQHLLMAYPTTVWEDDTEQWLGRRMAENGGVFKIVVDTDHQSMGFVQITNVHRRGRFGYCGICIKPTAQGRGIGAAAMALTTKLAIASLNLHKLILEVRADNLRALTLYNKIGFQTVGKFQNHYFDGTTWYDVFLLELLLERDPLP